jgi:hypothetical protein
MIDFFKFEWIRRKFRRKRSSIDRVLEMGGKVRKCLEMTPWERHISNLFCRLFIERDNNEDRIDCCLHSMFVVGLLGGMHGELKADELLKSTPEVVLSPIRKHFGLLSSDSLRAKILESAHSQDSPVEIEMFYYLRNLLDDVVPRLSVENMDEFRLLIDYSDELGDYFFTIGLFMHLECPDFALQMTLPYK